MDKSDFEWFSLIFQLTRALARLIHRLSGRIAGWLSRLLMKISSRLGSKEPEIRRRRFLYAQIAQIVIVLVAFILSSDRFRLFATSSIPRRPDSWRAPRRHSMRSAKT